MLGVDALIARLDDPLTTLVDPARVDHRRGALSVAIGLSWDGLSPDEQELLGLLAAFASPAGVDRLEAAAGRPVLDQLHTLVRRSMAFRVGDQLALLSSTRAFVSRALPPAQRDPLWLRHAELHAELAAPLAVPFALDDPATHMAARSLAPELAAVVHARDPEQARAWIARARRVTPSDRPRNYLGFGAVASLELGQAWTGAVDLDSDMPELTNALAAAFLAPDDREATARARSVAQDTRVQPLVARVVARMLEDLGRGWRFDSGGRGFESPEGARSEVGSKANRHLLAELVRQRIASPGDSLDVAALAAIGWPGEPLSASSAGTRVRTALSALRKAGLGELLVRSDGGWCLDPEVPVRVIDRESA